MECKVPIEFEYAIKVTRPSPAFKVRIEGQVPVVWCFASTPPTAAPARSRLFGSSAILAHCL